MKYYVLTLEKFKDTSKDLVDYMMSELNTEVEFVSVATEIEYVKKAEEFSKVIVDNNREGMALLMIDETGALGFTASSKVKGMITAQCSDEHSAHMTREHNGSVGLAMGANISSIYQIKSMVKLFHEEAFAAGRHMVRIDMLDKMA